MGIFSGLAHWFASRPALDVSLRQAVEQTVEAVDPRLRTISDYQRKLAPVVSSALSYCQTLSENVPGPVEINQRAFSDDPMIHAMFAAPGDIGEMLGRSRELREFMADPGLGDANEFFALLGMRQREKAVMGMTLQGGIVQNDVPQRLLYFSDHTLGELGNELQITRQRLQSASFGGLVQGFSHCVAELRQERDNARTAWNMERAGGPVPGERRQILEERQRQAVASLVPGRLLQALIEWLAAPQERLYLKPTAVTVDRMGVISPDSQPGGNFCTLNYPELVARDRRHWIVLLAKISRQDARDALARQEQANRYLII